MSRKPHDPTRLDELILGVDGDDELDAWEDLVRDPDAAEAWRAATDSRRRTDAFAALVLRHSVVARAARALRRHLRSGAALSMPVRAIRLDTAWATMASSGGPPDLTKDVPLLSETVIELPIGATVELTVPDAESVTWFGSWLDGQGLAHDERLERPRWHMDPGEAPILLVAIAGADAAADIAAALAGGRRLASVLLVEAAH